MKASLRVVRLFVVTVVFMIGFSSAVRADEFRGDFDCNGDVNITDLYLLYDWLFDNGSGPCCLEAADINNDDSWDGADYIALRDYLFFGCGSCLASPLEVQC